MKTRKKKPWLNKKRFRQILSHVVQEKKYLGYKRVKGGMVGPHGGNYSEKTLVEDYLMGAMRDSKRWLPQ